MDQFIGLTLDKALKTAQESGLNTAVRVYETKRSNMEKDRDIVVRAKQQGGAITFTVCGFKTNV